MYSSGMSEEIVGRAIRDFSSRDKVVLATKVFFRTGNGPNDRGLSRKHIFDAVGASLRRLGTDYIDLYQVHRWDYHTPIAETMRALDDLVRSGKVRYLGASSMFAHQFMKAQHAAELAGFTKFISMQNHYNLVYREEEREMIPLCVENGIGLIPWSPLARGFLAGNRTPNRSGETARARTDTFAHEMYFTDADFRVVERVSETAKAKNVSPAQIALAWIMNKPGVTAPIVGATRVSHIDDAVKAVKITLDDIEMKHLEEPYLPHPVLGHQ